MGNYTQLCHPDGASAQAAPGVDLFSDRTIGGLDLITRSPLSDHDS